MSSRSSFAVRRVFAAVISAATTVALCAMPGDAEAQEQEFRAAEGNGDGMDLHLFRPAVDSKGLFSVNGADILGHNDVSFGLVIDYGYGLLDTNPGHGPDFLVDNAFQGTLQFNYGLANMFVIGLTAPVVLNDGEPATDLGPTGNTYDDDKLNAQGLGDIALHVKWRIVRPDGDFPVGLAMVVQGGPEIATSRDFGSDPGFFYWPQAVIERHFGATPTFRIAANVGYRGHTGDNPQFGLGADGNSQLEAGVFEYSNLLTGGAGVSFRVLKALDFVGETYITQQLGGNSDAEQRFSAEALGGIKLFVERNSYLMMGAGAGYTPGFQAATGRGTIGFVFEPSIGDRDGDGIKDDEDDCPDDPEDFDGFQDTRTDSPPGRYGCPDPDNDDDGILDVDDRCPLNPEDHDGDEDEDGCPESSDGDRDGDGILDSLDKCPDVPEDRDGFEDKDGCPDPDNDKDGIPDVDDQCPNDPEDKDGFEDEDGCPDPDNDQDGIPDVRDKCPNEPENFNGHEDEDGCPDEGKIIIQDNSILILQKILFKTASAEILPESFGIVDAVAETLSHHPEFLLLEVQGHADERASDAYNLRLTQDRANAVVEALIKRKVERKRLRGMGYGEYCPIDEESNELAWDKNRRVEFKVLKTTDEGATGVQLGCAKSREKGVEPPPIP